MKLDIYLNFAGRCEEAFRFYERELGAKVIFVQKHGDQPNPQIPADWGQKVLHAQMQLAGVTIMGADIPNAEPMRSAYLSLTADAPEEADRLYALLSDGGQIFMKMETTFFANRFAMLRDRFGISWMILQGVAG
jgi:PhnB protein